MVTRFIFDSNVIMAVECEKPAMEGLYAWVHELYSAGKAIHMENVAAYAEEKSMGISILNS